MTMHQLNTPMGRAPHFKPFSTNNVILIASGKGGVGKTCISIGLSQALAHCQRKVLLFDGDLGMANVDIQLGLTPQHDLLSFITGKTTLQETIYPYRVGGFDIIAGRSGSGSLSSLSMQRLTMVREGLRSIAPRYDFLFGDMGAGIDSTVRVISGFAKECFIVVTDEPTALTDAYAFIKVSRNEVPDVRMSIIVNMAESKEAGRRTYNTLLKACENFLGLTPPLLGIVHRDTKIRDSIRNQTSLLTRHPTSQAAKDIMDMAQRIILRPETMRRTGSR